jgi:SAM-dependent MidA family methyltransferase
VDAATNGSNAALVARIRDEILAAPGRRITFARFMELALTEPGLGYYAVSDRRPTREGDFLTAPELHPFFGRLIGRQIAEVWELLGRPETFTLREYGAGRGTLERHVREGLAADGAAVAHCLRWQPVDVARAAPTEAFTGAILANEFVDALPVHRVVQRDGRLRERFVTLDGDTLTEVEDEPSTEQLSAHLAADGVALADGQLAEVSLAAGAWLAEAARWLQQGLLLVIDYGHPAEELYGPRRMAGTLATYRNHAVGADPLAFIGRQDITAHVDVTALERAASAAGLESLGSTTQARFLVALGLGELLSELGRQPDQDPQAYVLARAAVARYLDPRHLGAFRVLAWGRGISRGISVESQLRGFPLGQG